MCARHWAGRQKYKDKSDMVFVLEDFTKGVFMSLNFFEDQFSHLEV